MKFIELVLWNKGNLEFKMIEKPFVTLEDLIQYVQENNIANFQIVEVEE